MNSYDQTLRPTSFAKPNQTPYVNDTLYDYVNDKTPTQIPYNSISNQTPFAISTPYQGSYEKTPYQGSYEENSYQSSYEKTPYQGSYKDTTNEKSSSNNENRPQGKKQKNEDSTNRFFDSKPDYNSKAFQGNSQLLSSPVMKTMGPTTYTNPYFPKPTSNVPTSNVPTTNVPTTLIKTTNVPTKFMKSTNVPTTFVPTTVDVNNFDLENESYNYVSYPSKPSETPSKLNDYPSLFIEIINAFK
jgi:hypothetical protein